MIEHLYIVPILLFSVIVHEIAHGWVAMRLGDPTAKLMGRLTLNPLPHIDVFGSIIIPLMSLAATGEVFIAWAKPVPVNPGYFKHPRRDDILVSIAGPLSNLVLAAVCSIAVAFLMPYVRSIGGPEDQSAPIMLMIRMFYGGVYLNIMLGIFNLIPVPPLDGSHVLASLLPASAASTFRKVGFVGIILLIFLLRVPFVAGAFHAAVSMVAIPFQRLMGLD